MGPENQSATDSTNAAGSPPDTNGVSDGVADERFYSKAEFDSKVRGIISQSNEYREELQRIRDQSEAEEQKRLQEQGEFKELATRANEKLTTLSSENEELKKQLEGLRGKESERIEGVAKSNEQRLKALPDKVRELAPPGLDADAMAAYLPKLEELAQSIGKPGVLSGVSSAPPNVKTAQEAIDERLKRAQNKMMGIKE